MNQRKHLAAAHAEIFQEGDKIIDSYSKEPTEVTEKVFGIEIEETTEDPQKTIEEQSSDPRPQSASGPGTTKLL